MFFKHQRWVWILRVAVLAGWWQDVKVDSHVCLLVESRQGSVLVAAVGLLFGDAVMHCQVSHAES